MKAAAIKKLVETCTLDQCRNAENQLIDGEVPEIEIEGNDEGEQLTHVLAAIEILEKIQEQGALPQDAMRAFFERVRNSIN